MRAFLPLLVNHHHLVLLITLILLAVSVGRCYSMSPSSSAAVKRILVTGGNKGIGKAICEKLLTEWKDTHVLLGARDREKGEQAVADLVRSIGGDCKDRLELIVLDTSSDDSVKQAAQSLKESSGGGGELYGIINNAGIGWGYTMAENVNTNYFGPRRVNEAFGSLLQRPGGCIVNIASASGPNYVSSLPDSSPHKALLAKLWTIPGGLAELDQLSQHVKGEGYGASKALLNAYTVIHSKLEQGALRINSVTPGFIQTDLTAGTSASNPPFQGAGPPCWLMMDEGTVPTLVSMTGRYYGSDCVRSPLSFYRGPGEPPYESDEDLVDLPESASNMASVF